MASSLRRMGIQWLVDNAHWLSNKYGGANVAVDDINGRFVLIRNFLLPCNWLQSESQLLIVFPDIAKIFATEPNHFYLEKGLRNIRGEVPTHYFEDHGYNDLWAQGWARYSFHVIKGWHPRIPCIDGTNLTDVLRAMEQGMYQAGERG